MTSNQGGGTHPGDPWSPDWQPATPDEATEEEWPYDESLTLSEAELEIAGLDEDDDLEAEQPAAEEAEVEESEPEPEELEPEALEPEEPESVDTEADEAAAREAEELAAREAEEAAAKEAEELAAREAEEAAAREAKEAEEAAAREAKEAEEAAAKEAEELAAREAEEAAAREAREAEEAAAREAKEAEELAAREAEEAAAREAKEAEELAAREAEEAAAREAREAEEAAAREAREAEEAAAREAKEAEEAAAKEAEELAAREAEEAAAREAREAEEAAAREAEELAAREAEEAAAREAREAEEAAAREAEELAAREAEAREAREAEEAEEAQEPEPEVALRVITDASVGDELDDGMRAPIEEVAVEDLQAEPEWLEAVEEMTLDDIAEAGDDDAVDDLFAAVPDDEPVADEAETPTEVIESIAAGVEADEDLTDVVIEDATFEVVDLDDADLRADTAEHMFDVLDIEEAIQEDEPIAHDEITAEVEIGDDVAVDPDLAGETELVELAAPPLPSFHYEVPAVFDVVASDVDETRDALAAFMMPKAAEVASEESVEQVPDEPEEEPRLEEEADVALPEGVAETADGQLRIPTAADEPLSILEEARPLPVQAAQEPEPEPEPVEDAPLRPEDELIAQLTGDLTMPDFETFVQEDFARDFVAEPTQEHVGLAETISTAEAPEQSAVAATMPGVDHGHVGFEEFDEDLHFEDPDAVDVDEVVAEPDADGTDPYSSDLTLRAASAVILVALLAATLWAGGVVFLLFIGVIALAAQIEFYAAVRTGGFRPLVLFGLLGGLGALIGTYVQGSDAIRQGPVAIPAALGLTVVATFAWYGSQDSPPSDPWRNGLVTILGVAWIPALLALVLPMAELERSDRVQIIIALLIAVAAFDVGSYFVGRALGSRKLSPILSPNKTVEGLIGGIIATVIVALLAAALVDAFDLGTALAVAAGVIVASPLGDLAESLMKRSLEIKDMGQLIPGHGGVLDRIDSYLFAVPIAYLVLRWTGLL